MSETDTRFMALALSMGQRGLGRVWPNPAVGCVIVNDGIVVGRGWTQVGGRPHAETVALGQAGAAAKGATAYVTLEPCAHQGQTPPCATALIDAGVARVVVAASDPDPRVNGEGIAIMRSAGVQVDTDILREQAAAQNAGFFLRINENRPFVTLKLASSLDGRIATATGESQWITSPLSRRLVHAMRAEHDAVLVGGGTARADDPTLTARDLGSNHQPVRVVWSRRIDLPLMGQLAQTAGDVPVWICHGKDAETTVLDTWQDLGAKLLPCDIGVARNVDPHSALRMMADQGITRVLCEGGGALAASLLVADLVDELVCFTAGLGLGAEGQPMLGAMGLDRLSHAPRFELQRTCAIGGDVLHRWLRSRT